MGFGTCSLSGHGHIKICACYNILLVKGHYKCIFSRHSKGCLCVFLLLVVMQ